MKSEEVKVKNTEEVKSKMLKNDFRVLHVDSVAITTSLFTSYFSLFTSLHFSLLTSHFSLLTSHFLKNSAQTFNPVQYPRRLPHQQFPLDCVQLV